MRSSNKPHPPPTHWAESSLPSPIGVLPTRAARVAGGPTETHGGPGGQNAQINELCRMGDSRNRAWSTVPNKPHPGTLFRSPVDYTRPNKNHVVSGAGRQASAWYSSYTNTCTANILSPLARETNTIPSAKY